MSKEGYSQSDTKRVTKTIEVEFLHTKNKEEIKVTVKEHQIKKENCFFCLEDFLESNLGCLVCENICKDILKIKNFAEYKLFDKHGIFIRQLSSEIFKSFFHNQKASPDVILSEYNDETYEVMYNPKQNLNAFYAIRSLIH